MDLRRPAISNGTSPDARNLTLQSEPRPAAARPSSRPAPPETTTEGTRQFGYCKTWLPRALPRPHSPLSHGLTTKVLPIVLHAAGYPEEAALCATAEEASSVAFAASSAAGAAAAVENLADCICELSEGTQQLSTEAIRAIGDAQEYSHRVTRRLQASPSAGAVLQPPARALDWIARTRCIADTIDQIHGTILELASAIDRHAPEVSTYETTQYAAECVQAAHSVRAVDHDAVAQASSRLLRAAMSALIRKEPSSTIDDCDRLLQTATQVASNAYTLHLCDVAIDFRGRDVS